MFQYPGIRASGMIIEAPRGPTRGTSLKNITQLLRWRSTQSVQLYSMMPTAATICMHKEKNFNNNSVPAFLPLNLSLPHPVCIPPGTYA